MLNRIKVLDRGFIRLVESMGADAGVVQAARVSLGQGFKGEEKDRRLIHYLLHHGHMTPFEHAVFKFHVKLPIFVMRQWIRHRAACLTGDTVLTFDLPSGVRRGKFRCYQMTVEDLHRKWHEGARPIPHAKRPSSSVIVPQRERLKRMSLRNLHERAWTLGHTRIVDVFRTGEKPVFEVRLEDGKIIRCTKDHRFFFKEGGWRTLDATTGLELRNGLAVYSSPLPYLAVNGRSVDQPLYRDREWLEAQYRGEGHDDRTVADLLGVSPHVIRKWRFIHGIAHIKPAGFPKGHMPWNKHRSYKLWNGARTLSQAHLEAIRKARSGTASNFWKGGASTARAGIARWTTQAAPRIFARDSYTCRACGCRGGKLHAHHVIPVWADRSRAMEEANLATLCGPCHRRIHNTDSDLAFASTLLGEAAVRPLAAIVKPRPRHLKMVPRWVRIVSIRYLGVLPTFDLTVEGPDHNYVANGIVTHNSYNEISARYAEVSDEFYVPGEFRVQDPANKQGSIESRTIDQARARRILRRAQAGSFSAYRELLDAGVAREMARLALPVSLYTQFYWTVNARSLMHFIGLRADSSAQWEMRRYAEGLAVFFRQKMPWTWEAFLRYTWEGANPILDGQKRRQEAVP